MKVHVGLREERLEGHRLAQRIALLFPAPVATAAQGNWTLVPVLAEPGAAGKAEGLLVGRVPRTAT